jgi:RND family efflux transporter MFP subunit
MPGTQQLTPSGGTKILHVSHAPSNGGHQPSHESEVELHRPAFSFSRFTVLVVICAALATFGGAFVLASIPRRHQSAELEAESERIKTALPSVRVTLPHRAPKIAVAMLPGDVRAMEEITIYPRTTGYIKRWMVDIGDEAKAGQLLAEIDTPEIRAQLQQSEAALGEGRASLERAKATVNLTTIVAKRLRGLISKKAIAQQDLDNAESNLEVAVANVNLSEATIKANEASVQHMRELLTFCEIRSPFAGTVTSRQVNTGTLVTSGNGTGQALFQLARTNPVRVFVNVPQIYAPGIMVGLQAEITLRDKPGRIFRGKVTRTAGAIDQLTRTLLTEIQVPNEDHALLTGSYVQVRMDVERQSPPLLIPSSALIFNAGGDSSGNRRT